MLRTFFVLLVATAALSLQSAPLHAQQGQTQGKRLYKWVDEQGNVHYSDRLEGQVSGTPERLNSSGIRVGAQHSALPSNRQEAREQEQARRQAQHDAMLLSSYRSEIELLRAHDEHRIPLENSLRAAEDNIARLRNEIRLRQSSRGGDPIAEEHEAAPELANLREQLVEAESRLKDLQEKRFELHERQNAEVARYRELIGANLKD